MPEPDFLLVIAGLNNDHRSVVEKHYSAGYLAVHFTIAGSFSLTIAERSWDLEGPVLWTGYPGPRFRFAPTPGGSKPWQDYYFGIAGSLPRRWLANGLFFRRPRPLRRVAEAKAAAVELIGLRAARDGVAVRQAANLMERLLLLVAEDGPREKKPDWLDLIERRAAAEPAWQPDWDAVARGCGLPPSTFRKRFQRLVGRPPQRWLIERRIGQARDLLASGLGVAEVAERLGYADSFFFSRQFRTWAGIAPSAYARGETG